MSALITNLEKMLAAGRDNALLRFGLGNEYLKLHQSDVAIGHLRRAVELDTGYSAAWKLLGRALAESGNTVAALAAYHAGISHAEAKGDIQAAKEMRVFARRLEKELKGKILPGDEA